MSEKLKPYLAWVTFLLMLISVGIVRYQMTTVIFAFILGIAGTVLIFFTEVGYTYRKTGLVKVGSVRTWLRTHIFMGIVGPLILIWHTGLMFYGFAGWLAALTAVVVVSGFIGRYIYRLIPRSIKGQELTLRELEAQAKTRAAKLAELMVKSPEAAALIKAVNEQLGSGGLIGGPPGGRPPGLLELFKSSIDWEIARWRLRRLFAGRRPIEHQLLHDIKALELEQLTLRRRINLLDTSKATLSNWTIFHKPLTLILFVGILLHVINVFYYGKVLP